MKARVFVALFCVGGWLAEPRRTRDVRTTQGYTRGYFAPQPPHYAFLGIPYAAVRTRFKVSIVNWSRARWTKSFIIKQLHLNSRGTKLRSGRSDGWQSSHSFPNWSYSEPLTIDIDCQ